MDKKPPPHVAFGNFLKALRKERKLTQQEAANAIGISRGHLASMERGRDLPGRDRLLALAAFYRVHINSMPLSGSATSSPNGSQLVNDPDKLAWLAFWDDLTPAERLMAIRQLLGRRKPTE